VVGYRYQDNVNPPSFSHTASYTYDGVNRLSTATAKTMGGSTIWSQTYGSQSYSHPDQWGNWTCSGSGACPSLTWNSQNNHLLTIGANNPLPFSYDAAGNLTQDPSNYPLQPVHYYQWDAEGRVASVDSGSTWSFTYNALGHRVQWASPSGGELHLFDPEGNWLGNANSYTLVRFGERPLALYEGSQTYFNHVSALGSTSMFTNQTGGPQEDMLFYPWGDVWQGSGGYNFAYLPYRDLSTTTDITTARFYSPNFGRWFSPDPDNVGAHPSDPQTWNMYAYVRNNPTTLTDPSGQYTCASSVTQQECDNFQSGLNQAQQAANALKDKYGADSDQYQSAERAIDAYGKEGVDNGVVVAQGNTGDYAAKTQVAGVAGAITADNPTGQNIRVTLNKDLNLLGGDNTNGLAMLAAHEGSHVADASDWVASGFSSNANPSNYRTEFDAYRVTGNIAEGLGYSTWTETFGKNTTYSFSLPLTQNSNGAIGSMIKREYPGYNLHAFQRNTRLP